MVKTSKEEIEKDNQLLLDVLIKNSNKSINDIANKLGFSRQKVWRMIKELENNHKIWGYTAVIDFNKQNLKYYMILAKRSNKPIDKQIIEKVTTREFEEKLEQMGGKLITSMYVNGIYDWFITFTCNNIIKAKKIYELFSGVYHEYLDKCDLLEGLFPCKLYNIPNPDIENLNKMFP
jgi:DNA-binding Lrp family transcriptional regulator